MGRVSGYRRSNTRLRFEPDQEIPEPGDSWRALTELGRVPVTVTLLAAHRTFEHPSEPGVTLMDARVSTRERTR